MIVLTLGGIVVALSSWVYDTYKNRQEVFLSEVERSLFDVIQRYYNDHEEMIREARMDSFKKSEVLLFRKLQKGYPAVDPQVLSGVLDTVAKERFRYFGKRRDRNAVRSNEDSTQLFLPFMMQSISFDKATLSELDSRLTQALIKKKIGTEVQIELIKSGELPSNGKFAEDEGSLGLIRTRPIMIDPADGQYLQASIADASIYILRKMAGQLALSLFIIVALIGTFIYLLWTINRQKQLALQHKTFVNNMTHELKTPVATVMAAVEALQRFGAKDDKLRMEKYLDLSRKELEHLSTIIERVLEFDIHSERRAHLHLQRFDLREVVQYCIDCARIGSSKKVTFELSSNVDPLWIVADEAQIKNVCSNLIDNAIKYADDTVHINIQLEDGQEGVLFRIIDNGMGIAKGHHNDIFKMFFRVPTGDVYPVKGFGLGLPFVKQVVEQHGGKIWVESALGEGTTFNIKLPKLTL